MRFLTWIIYITLLFISAAFMVLYKDMLALTLLCVVLSVPVLMLLNAVILRLLVRIKCELSDGVMQVGENAVLKITVKNMSPFSAPKIALKISCDNSFMSAQSDLKTYISTSGFSSKTFNYKITSGHVGKMKIHISKAHISDIFGMFSFPYRIKQDSFVTFIPQVFDCGVYVRNNIFAVGETEVFSPNKKGDDPSEVFNIRDYQGGDKLNRIHWKLSAKQNHYMVKEYSRPISENVLLLADLCVKDASEINKIDSVFCALISVGYELIKAGKIFSIGWFHSTDKKNDGKYLTEKINDENDLYVCLSHIFSSHTDADYSDILQNDFIGGFSHKCLFTADNPTVTGKRLSAAQQNNNNVTLSAVCIGDNKETEYAEFDSEQTVNYLHKEHIAADLAKLVI